MDRVDIDKPRATERLLELDALRGIAAISVMLYHYSVRYDRLYGHGPDFTFRFPYGNRGVQLFFMISGFVIFMTLNRIPDLRAFIISRFSRLYPAYWASVLLTATTISIFSLPGRELPSLHAVINLTMFQTWLRVRNIDGVYWSLAVELAFYFWMGILYFKRKVQAVEGIGLGWLMMTACCHLSEYLAERSLPPTLRVLLLLDHWNLFFAGMIFYRLKEGTGTRWHHLLIGLCLLAQFWNGPSKIGSIVFFFAVFYLFVYGKLSFLSTKPLIYLGTISYSLYLVHQNFGYVMIRGLYRLQVAPALILVLPVICSLTVASLIAFYIERPALVAIRRIFSVLKSPTVT